MCITTAQTNTHADTCCVAVAPGMVCGGALSTSVPRSFVQLTAATAAVQQQNHWLLERNKSRLPSSPHGILHVHLAQSAAVCTLGLIYHTSKYYQQQYFPSGSDIVAVRALLWMRYCCAHDQRTAVVENTAAKVLPGLLIRCDFSREWKSSPPLVADDLVKSAHCTSLHPNKRNYVQLTTTISILPGETAVHSQLSTSINERRQVRCGLHQEDKCGRGYRGRETTGM